MLEGDAIDAVRELEQRDGRAIQLWGSASLAPTDGEARTLERVDVQQAATGTLLCTYRPVQA